MKLKWTQDIKDPKEKTKFKESIRNSKFILDKLSQICYNMLEENRTSSTKDYDSPGWAFRQADKVGYERALRDIIKLLQIDPEEN